VVLVGPLQLFVGDQHHQIGPGTTFRGTCRFVKEPLLFVLFGSGVDDVANADVREQSARGAVNAMEKFTDAPWVNTIAARSHIVAQRVATDALWNIEPGGRLSFTTTLVAVDGPLSSS